jgi:hypothetical protein
MAVDPVGVMPDNVHSFNRYAYANNNPYKYIDPDGKAPKIVPFTAGGSLWVNWRDLGGVGGGWTKPTQSQLRSLGGSGNTLRSRANTTESSQIVPKKVDTPHTQVTGGNKTAGAPKTNKPNSIHEQTRPDGSKSVTYYNEKGRMFSREDYGQQRTHGQLGRGADGRSVPHEHGVDWSDRGPIGKKYRELDSSGKPVGPWINE